MDQLNYKFFDTVFEVVLSSPQKTDTLSNSERLYKSVFILGIFTFKNIIIIKFESILIASTIFIIIVYINLDDWNYIKIIFIL